MQRTCIELILMRRFTPYTFQNGLWSSFLFCEWVSNSWQWLAITVRNKPESPMELEYDRWQTFCSFSYFLFKNKDETDILTWAPSPPQLLNAGFLQSCTSSPKTVLLLHDWWWLNLGSDPYNLHISESPLLSQRETNGCLLGLQAEQPSGRMLASFWAWKNSQQFKEKKGKTWVKDP